MDNKQAAITRDMTVLDVVCRHSKTEAVFKRYDAHAGECICCNVLFETLEAMAAKYGLDFDRLLVDLEAAV